MNRNLKIVLDTNALIDLWTQDAEAFQAMLPSRDSSSNFFVPGSIRRELKSRSVNTEESEEVRNLCDKLTRVLQNEKSKSGAAFSEEMPPARGGRTNLTRTPSCGNGFGTMSRFFKSRCGQVTANLSGIC